MGEENQSSAHEEIESSNEFVDEMRFDKQLLKISVESGVEEDKLRKLLKEDYIGVIDGLGNIGGTGIGPFNAVKFKEWVAGTDFPQSKLTFREWINSQINKEIIANNR